MGKKPKRRLEIKSELKERSAKRKEKKRAKKIRELDGEAKGIPKTIESCRIKDETTVGDINDEDNIETLATLNNDEFCDYFNKTYEPKVLITFSDNARSKTRLFCRELSRIIPNSQFLLRNRSSVKKMINDCKKKGFTDVLIVNENQKEPNGLLVIHLPDGPTALFKLSNIKITSELRKSYKEITQHRPEIILNNFTTRLGVTISRMLASLFHYEPNFKGRRAVTFHNQRDYIFFRHHRYQFNNEGKPGLLELGPRFTMKLRSLQEGTFDSITGEYIWTIQGRRHEMQTSRRKFFL